jgi:hypothetical protein
MLLPSHKEQLLNNNSAHSLVGGGSFAGQRKLDDVLRKDTLVQVKR